MKRVVALVWYTAWRNSIFIIENTQLRLSVFVFL